MIFALQGTPWLLWARGVFAVQSRGEGAVLPSSLSSGNVDSMIVFEGEFWKPPEASGGLERKIHGISTSSWTDWREDQGAIA